MTNFRVTKATRLENHYIAGYWKDGEHYSVSAHTDDEGAIQYGMLIGPRKSQRLDLTRHAKMVTKIQNAINV